MEVKINTRPARSNQRGSLASSQNAQTLSAKKKNRSRVRKNRRGNTKMGLHLSPCALSYAKARLDPFNYTSNEPPCIPDLLELPSQKVTTLDRFSFQSGTQGFGYCMISAHVGSNNQNRGWVSSNAYTGVTTPTVGSTTGNIYMNSTRYPYSATTARPYRIVSCSLRVRYIGTELNRGGQFLLLPLNSFVATGANGYFGTARDFNVVATLPEAMLFPVEKRWRTIGWAPSYPEAYEYDTVSYPIGTGEAYNASLVCLVNGTVPGVGFECELLTNYEIISGANGTVPGETKSHSDIPGMSFIRDYFSSEAVQEIGTAAYQKFLRSAASYSAAAAMSYFGPGRPQIEYV
jgi:hypothetical protein